MSSSTSSRDSLPVSLSLGRRCGSFSLFPAARLVAAQTVGVAMTPASPVHDLLVKLCQAVLPPGPNSSGVFEGLQPLQGGVICGQFELPSYQVVPEIFAVEHYRQQLTLGHTVVSLWLAQPLTGIGYGSLHAVLYLRQHCTNSYRTGVCV